MATQIGIVKTLTGEVTATAADGSIRTLQVGDRVYANELISTGQAGALEIEFSDGSIMDLGRNSQAMLDSAVFDPSSAVADASEEDVPDDVAAIQQALLEGEDPTEVGEATAAGAGVQGGNEGHDAVFVDYLNPEVTPDAGFETIGVNSEIDDIEEEQLLDGVPTAGLTVVTLDEDELVEGGSVDLGTAGNEFLNFLNGQGISAFTFDSPNGVGDERPEVGDDPADGYFLSGSLVAAYGLDGPNEDDPISFNAVTGSDVTDSNGNPVTSEGQQVKYWVSADGLTVIGYIAGDSDQSEQPSPQVKSLQTANYDGCEGPGEDYPELAEIIFTAQLTPTEEGGSFLVGIFGQFDHAEPDYANGEFVFEDNLLLNLGFTITDADGDSTTGTLQLDVDDDSPVRAGEGEQLATQTGTVTEDGLSFDDGDLSEGNPNNAVAMTVTSDNSDADQSDIESFFGLSAGALEPAVDSNGGSGNATNGSASKSTLNAEAGDIISFNWSFDNNDGGSFNDFAFVVINGEVFELADSNGGDLASNPFTYEVTADGVISIGFGQMNVGDQIVDSSLTVSDLTLNGSPVNGGFDGSLTGWDTLGNVSDTDSLVNSDVTSGNLNTVVNMGADGPGSFGLLQASENEAEQALFQAGMDSLPTLSSKGEAVSYSVMMDGSDSVLVATAGEGDDAREVFTLTIDSDGQWTFDLNDQLDHVAGETAEENFSLITLDENGEPNGSVDSIDFTQLLQIRDFDGDQLIITEDDAGMLSISIQDDIPVATGETVNVSVDEDDIVTDNSTGNDPFDNADDGSYTGEPVTIFGYTTDFFNIFNGGGPATTTGSVSSLVSFGADETGTFSLGDNFAGLEGQGLTSKGDELSFEVNGDTLIASADGRAVFTLELADNGDFTFSLYDQLDHAAGNGENNLPLDLSSVIQATDSDNDTITLENGFVIDVTDDIPEQAGVLPDIGIVEEEALPAGNQEENDGSIFGYPIDGWPDTAVATGSLQDQVSVGADENLTFAFAADLSGLPELTSNGLPVSYEVNGDTLTASTEAGEVFTLTLNSEGDYVFTLTGALDHDAGQGENLEVINFSSIIEATDFDGDTITLDNDFYIKIVDDMPVATGESVSVTVDEDDIQTDNSSGNDSFDNDSDGSYTGEPVTIFGYTTDFFNIFNGGGPATTSGSVATLVSFGADENGTFSLGSDFAALEAQNLTSKGDELSFEVNGDTLVASADGRAVFTLELDDNGDFTFSLYDQLDHATGNGENNLPLDLSSVIQATDSDLDTITLDSGFTIDITDDVPEYAGAPDLGIVEEEALPAGNQEENDGSFFGIPLDGWPDTAVATGSLQDQVSVGADDDATFSLSGDYTSLIAQNLTSNDVPVTYQLDGDTLTASAGQTPVFTLTLSSNGDYIFTLMGPLDHPESYVEENPLVIDLSGVVIAEDFDGDAITLNNDLFIKIIDDSPEVDTNAVVRLDDDALTGGNPGGPGDNVDSANVTGTLSHSFGADGGNISWQTNGAPNGFSYEADGDDLLVKQDGTTVLTLTLDPATGEYSVTQNAPVDHRYNGNDVENNQRFDINYKVEDADGDIAVGSIRVNVDDDTPTVEPYEVNTMRIISDDDTVDGLNGNPGEGSNTNDGAGTDSKEYNQSKTLQFSAGADGGTVAWNVDNSSVDDATAGISFSVNGDGSLIITQMQNGVAVQVAEITLDANTGDYNYTQTSNVLHTPGDNENEAAFTLGFTVTDGDGDTADGYLTLLIDDDTPVVTSQQLNLLTESFEDFAPELGNNSWTVVGEGGGTIIGNNGIEWTVNGAGVEIQTGNVGGSSASDGNAHAELDAHDNNGDGGSTLTELSTVVDLPTSEAELTFDYKGRPADLADSGIEVQFGGQVVTVDMFNQTSSSAGLSYSYSSGVQVNFDYDFSSQWTTVTIKFSGLATGDTVLSFRGLDEQGDGDSLGAYLDNISLNAVANLTVDESALADGSGEAGASTTAVYDFSGFFTGEFGADGPADADSESYALNLNGADVGSGLFVVDNTDTSSTDGDGFGQGEEILLNQDGNQIVGSAGGVDYFTISVNDDGEVTLTQLENIWHADTTNPDDSQSMVLDAELLTLVKTITDADQDSAEATLDLGGVNFNFEDDAPAIEAQQPAQPYLLTITNEGGDAGYNNTYGYFIKGENGEPVSGEIIWANVKDNESSEVTVEVTDPSDIGFFIIPDGDDLNDLNNGDAVTFEQDGDGNWQVVLDGEPLSGQGTDVLFNDAALNQGGAQAVEDNAAAGNQNWEDIIGGDNDFNDVNINVSISQLGAITVDETDIGNGDPSNATATLDLSGSFTADFGADGEGDVDYGLSVDTDVNTGLIDTQSGEEVLLRVVDGEVEGYINDGSDQVVFTVTVDSDGEVTLTQLRAVEHDDATDPDEANSPATINAGAISLGATVTDADGDSADASLDLGVLFAFEDDGPVAVDDADSVVDGLAEGNVLTAVSTDGESGADSFGADGPGSVTSVTFGNTTYDVPSEGSVDIDGDFGTLTLHADGSYEYNVNSENVPQNTETVEGWVATDSNMTAFNLGESFLDADGKFSDTGSGTVTSGGNTPGFGVAGTSGANTSVPAQVNQSGSESEALAFKFTGDVTSATVQFSNLFNNENGGEAMRWHAFDADGNRIDSGIVSDNDASDPYAGDTTVSYSSNNEGSFTISDIGAFSTLVFEGVPYSNDGSDGADDSDFFVNITSYEVFGTESNQYQDQFTYEITDADGDSDSATLTINGQSEPEQGELDAIAPVAADNTYQVDGETSGNIITDDDDNGGAETGRDYDNDTPVINLSINSIIVNGVETELTADNTVIGLENGTLVINLDGSYTYTPDQDADGGDEFDYTLVDPDGEVSEPATVTLLEPLVSDVVTLGDVTVNEGDGTATITGSVESAVTGSPLVITLNNGATITIDIGETSGTSTPFPVQGDDPYIDGETITLSVTGTDGGNYSSLDTLDTSTVTVNDTIDDVTVVLSATSSTSEDGGSITYTASLVDGDNNPVTTNNAITVTLANGESITIAAGDSSGDSAPVAVNLDDLVLETDSIDNNITGISEDNAGTDGAFENLGYDDSTVSTTITDDSDGVNVVLSATSSTSEDGGSITYTASLVDGDNNPVTTNNAITVTLANGESITIAAGDSSRDSAPVAVNLDDVYAETDSIDNNITGISEDNAGTDGAFENLGYDDSTVSTTITDDSDAVTATLTTSTTEVDEDGGDITYTVTLSGGPGDIDPDADLVFNLANGEQVTISAGDTSGSFTRTYTDAEITNQVSITNSIQSIQSGGSEYEDLQTAGETSVDVYYAPIPDELYVGTNEPNTHETSGGNDVLIGDLGGKDQQFNPGKNYSIALIADESGSMDDDGRAQLLKDALESFVNDLADHDGVINIGLIGFSNNSSLEISVSDIANDSNALNDLLTEISQLEADGGTNYEAAFEDAVDWFGTQPSGHEFISYFMTDGDPTYSNSGSNGGGSTTNYEDLYDAVQAFQSLSAISEVNAIGIGSGVNTDYLRFFDNTNQTGTGTENFGTMTTELSTFANDDDPLDQLSDWSFENGSDSNGQMTITNGELRIRDNNGGPATTVNSNAFTAAVGSILSFDFGLGSRTSQADSFNWKLQKDVSGTWTDVQTGTLEGNGTITSDALDGGSYRLQFSVDDQAVEEYVEWIVIFPVTRESTNDDLYIDNINLESPISVTGPVGEPQVINDADELTAQLQTGNTTEGPADLGDDVLQGGEGDDVIFGDTLFTDDLTWTNTDTGETFSAGHGLGYEGLVEYLTWSVNGGTAPDDAQIMQYIRDNYDDLINPNPTQAEIDAAGDDTLIGGGGNDILIGGEGADIFQWNEGDDGTTGSPAVDYVVDFDASEGDVLDLADLLDSDGSNTIDATNLDDYLKANFDSVENTTTVEVYTNGDANSGGQSTQNIVLNGEFTQQDLTNLLNNNNLDVDQS